MPHFTLQVGDSGPILNALITVSEARSSALQAQKAEIPNGIKVQGLVDTGASGTCVDPSVIEQLGIPPTGEATMLTPSTKDGPVPATQYDVGLQIYAEVTQPPLVIRNLPVMESHLRQQGIHALIGRDVLSKCILIYNGAIGIYTLSF